VVAPTEEELASWSALPDGSRLLLLAALGNVVPTVLVDLCWLATGRADPGLGGLDVGTSGVIVTVAAALAVAMGAGRARGRAVRMRRRRDGRHRAGRSAGAAGATWSERGAADLGERRVQQHQPEERAAELPGR
jgi:hypothetical protein